MIYDVNGDEIVSVYDAYGSAVENVYDANGNAVAIIDKDYSNYSISNYCTISLTPTQALDIVNGTIFQLLASSSISDKMATVDVSNSTIISSNIPITSDHGNSASFSHKYYVVGDDFPLLYVSSWSEPKVYIDRVTQSSSQLIKTLSFTTEKAGYHPCLAYDESNEIAYMLGYTEDNYLTDDSGNNKVLISKWDMSDVTENQDGTFTPEFISSVERPFIYVMQGLQFHDGMIWVSSGGTNVRGYVYALDPADGSLLYTVDTSTTTEIEGIAFLPDGNMIFGLQGGEYKLVTFANAS